MARLSGVGRWVAIRNAHHRDARSVFRWSPRDGRIHAVPAIDALQRVADLRLRGASAMPVRVRWPTGARRLGPLAVFLPDLDPRNGVDPTDDELCRQLCAGVGAVVLCAPLRSARLGSADSSLERAASVLEWSADHAAELGADPNRLLLAGSGAGAAAAVVLALRARDRGWPRIAHQLLVLRGGGSCSGESCAAARSAIDEPPTRARVAAPAIVAASEGHCGGAAERLRARGIDVDERPLEELGSVWRALCRALGERAA
jgi:acetyl esterase/lipase